jgi:excisionase family DNA binding protein
MSLEDAEPLLMPAEVATMFRVDPKTVTRWAKAGRLTSIRTLGGHRRYREREVRALLGEVPEKPPDPLKAPVHQLWREGAMPAVVRNRLRAAGVATVGNLTGCDAAALRDCGLSAALVDEVRLVLYRKGLALYGEVLGEVA